MHDDVCVLIPTLDEAETIGTLIDGFTRRGYTDVLVVDGGSTDGTREIAADRGARVVEQSGDGKGQAVREAVGFIEKPLVLMLDGDGTYDPDDAERMLEPLREGRAEHVVGNRFADLRPGAMPRLNGFGNRLINRSFAIIHGRDLADILSGYRAFTRTSMERLDLQADGFTIETEMAVECVKHRVPTTVVPVTYRPRPDESDPNLNPLRDGARIVGALYSLARLNNPLFYFGVFGGLSALVGLVIGGYVGYEWFIRTPPISHEALAVVSAFFLLLGVQVFMFGLLSDMIVTVNREQMRQMEELMRNDTVRSARQGAEDVPDSGGAEWTVDGERLQSSDSRGED